MILGICGTQDYFDSRGDFHGESNLIGKWARDSISVEEEAPKGYEMIDFKLTE